MTFATSCSLQINLIDESQICPNLKIFNTTNQVLEPQKLNMRPDISILSAIDNKDVRPDRLHWRAVDLWIENKNKEKDDVFRKLDWIKTQETAMASSQEGGEERSNHDLARRVEWSKAACEISGQLIAYATAIHRCQFRVFSFSVAFFGMTGRLLRWDRSGIIFTKSFNWYEQHDTFFEFLWRLNHLSDVDCGYDTTVTSVSDHEAKAALPKLLTYPGLEKLKKKEDLHKFLVRDDGTPEGRVKYYITAGPIWDSQSLFGRSTLGYIGYDMETTNLVYLKDFWRTDLPGIQKEGDVYRELHSAQVSNIARLGLAGDVPKTPGSMDTEPGEVQRTRTQEFGDGCGRAHVDPYVHYRLVLETLGRPLTTFKSTRQLCEVIRDAIVGVWTRFNSRCCKY